MRNSFLAAGLIGLAIAGAPAIAQDNTGSAMGAGAMSANDVGAQPMTGTPSTNYVAWAADSDMYEIQSSQMALSKAKSDGVKQFAREMIQDHKTTTKTLMAALPKTDPKVAKPPMKPAAPTQAKLDQLRQADGASFDSLYLQQQMQAHQQAWALHKGYATDGSDPALKQVATAAVPIIEKHLQHLKSMPAGSGM
jgi:putative membrane protein